MVSPSTSRPPPVLARRRACRDLVRGGPPVVGRLLVGVHGRGGVEVRKPPRRGVGPLCVRRGPGQPWSLVLAHLVRRGAEHAARVSPERWWRGGGLAAGWGRSSEGRVSMAGSPNTYEAGTFRTDETRGRVGPRSSGRCANAPRAPPRSFPRADRFPQRRAGDVVAEAWPSPRRPNPAARTPVVRSSRGPAPPRPGP
jgi:hypothetical protein